MDLAARVARLEAANRRLKYIGLGLCVMGAVAVAMGQARTEPPGPVRASEFAAVDAQGKVRARLAVVDGEPTLELTNAADQTVAQLQVPAVPDRPALYLRDPSEGTGIELAMTMNGPVLHFYDRSGTRVRLATNELNAPLAAVYDSKGKSLLKVTAEPE